MVFDITQPNPGTNSPRGCGDNSSYDVHYAILRVPDVHELRLERTGWAQADLSAIVTNNPPAFPLTFGSPLAALVTPDGIRRIFYVGQDNHIRELRLEQTGWAQADLSAIVTNNPPAFPLVARSPLPAFVTPDGIPRILYLG